MGEVTRGLNDSGLAITACPVTPKLLADLLALIDKGTISGKIAKTVFDEMWQSGKEPAKIVEEKGLVQVSDTGAIEKIVDEIMAANMGQVEEFRGGKEKVLGFFVGQVMKASKGKANPALVNEILLKKLKGEGPWPRKRPRYSSWPTGAGSPRPTTRPARSRRWYGR